MDNITIPVQCWTPDTCDTITEMKTSETVSVQFDKITAPVYVDCKCVEKK